MQYDTSVSVNEPGMVARLSVSTSMGGCSCVSVLSPRGRVSQTSEARYDVKSSKSDPGLASGEDAMLADRLSDNAGCAMTRRAKQSLNIELCAVVFSIEEFANIVLKLGEW